MAERIFKFLVVADGTPESRLAGYFAARRAKHTGGRVVLLSVLESSHFHHWLGVGAEMNRAERAEAELAQSDLADDVRAETGEEPERLMRDGPLIPALKKVIERDREISILVVGSAPYGAPGPIVSAVAKGGRGLFGDRAIPVAVVPSTMSREEIHALA